MAHFSKLVLAAALISIATPAIAQEAQYPMAKTYSSVEEALAAASSQPTYTTRRVVMPVEEATPIQSIEIYEQPLETTASSGQIYTYESPTATYSYAAPAAQSPSNVSYAVVLGDTLWSIANRNGLKVSQLMNANNLTSSAIQPGQILTIPSAALTQTYVQQVPVQDYSVTTAVQRNVTALPGSKIYAVLPGDTLYSISKANCVSVTSISRASGISTTATISPGQRLTLPAGTCPY